jgi:D-sedoheptulose 7-phosphate isomerase
MKCEDVLVCLSTSGNSVNVYNAALTARAKRGKVISITGQAGGRLSSVSDVIIRLPSAETFRIHEYTLPVYHALCAMLEEEFFGE